MNNYKVQVHFDDTEELELVFCECESAYEAERHAETDAVYLYGIDESRIDYIEAELWEDDDVY